MRINGFTLIELVVVILLLGVLSAVALPKFLNLSSKAHKTAVQGVAGAMSSAVSQAHAEWRLNGGVIGNSITDSATRGKVVVVGGNNVTFNGVGWPECSRDFPRVRARCGNGSINSSNRECDSLIKAIMQSTYSFAYYRDFNNDDFFVFEPGETDQCQYTYAKSFEASNPSSDLCVLYDTNDGSVKFLQGTDCSRERTP